MMSSINLDYSTPSPDALKQILIQLFHESANILDPKIAEEIFNPKNANNHVKFISKKAGKDPDFEIHFASAVFFRAVRSGRSVENDTDNVVLDQNKEEEKGLVIDDESLTTISPTNSKKVSLTSDLGNTRELDKVQIAELLLENLDNDKLQKHFADVRIDENNKTSGRIVLISKSRLREKISEGCLLCPECGKFCKGLEKGLWWHLKGVHNAIHLDAKETAKTQMNAIMPYNSQNAVLESIRKDGVFLVQEGDKMDFSPSSRQIGNSKSADICVICPVDNENRIKDIKNKKCDLDDEKYISWTKEMRKGVAQGGRPYEGYMLEATLENIKNMSSSESSSTSTSSNSGTVGAKTNEDRSLGCDLSQTLVFARDGKLDEIRNLIESKNFNPSETDRNGSSALMWAAGGGHLEICKLLVQNFPDHYNPKTHITQGRRSFYGRTALHWAARNGNLNIAKWLIEEIKVDVDSKTEDGTTAFHWAAWQNHLETMIYLKEKGTDIHCKNSYGCNVSMWAVQGTGDVEICHYLARNGVKFDLVNTNGHSCIHKAAQRNKKHVLKFLLDLRQSDNNSKKENINSREESFGLPMIDLDLGISIKSAKVINEDHIGLDFEKFPPSGLARVEGFERLADWLEIEEGKILDFGKIGKCAKETTSENKDPTTAKANNLPPRSCACTGIRFCAKCKDPEFRAKFPNQLQPIRNNDANAISALIEHKKSSGEIVSVLSGKAEGVLVNVSDGDEENEKSQVLNVSLDVDLRDFPQTNVVVHREENESSSKNIRQKTQIFLDEDPEFFEKVSDRILAGLLELKTSQNRNAPKPAVSFSYRQLVNIVSAPLISKIANLCDNFLEGLSFSEEFVNEAEESELLEILNKGENLLPTNMASTSNNSYSTKTSKNPISCWTLSQSGREKADYGPKANYKKQELKIGSFFEKEDSYLPEILKSNAVLKRVAEFSEAVETFEKKNNDRKDQDKNNNSATFKPVGWFFQKYTQQNGSNFDFHIDDQFIFGDRILDLSLNSDANLSFRTPILKTEIDFPKQMRENDNSSSNNLSHFLIQLNIKLPRRSMLVFSKSARNDWFHAVLENGFEADERYSLTVRELGISHKNSEIGERIEKLAEVGVDDNLRRKWRRKIVETT